MGEIERPKRRAATLDRSLEEILADIESGIPLSTYEQLLVDRLAARLAMTPQTRQEFSTAWREAAAAVAMFAPPGKPAQRSRWVARQVSNFMSGPDWRMARLSVLPPFRDPLRVALWTLSRMGGAPCDRILREVAADVTTRSDATDIAST
jgi:hypothetical protein